MLYPWFSGPLATYCVRGCNWFYFWLDNHSIRLVLSKFRVISWSELWTILQHFRAVPLVLHFRDFNSSGIRLRVSLSDGISSCLYIKHRYTLVPDPFGDFPKYSNTFANWGQALSLCCYIYMRAVILHGNHICLCIHDPHVSLWHLISVFRAFLLSLYKKVFFSYFGSMIVCVR